MQIILAYLHVTRFHTSIVIAFAISAPAFANGYNIINSLYVAFPFFLSALGGFAFNDFCDITKDRVNHPHRALPSGKISPIHCLMLSMVLLLGAVIAAFQISTKIMELILNISAIVGIILYNLIVRNIGLLKNVFAAILSSLPFVLVLVIFEYPRIFILMPMASFFFILGKEILMDIRDIEGDANSGIFTVAMFFGKYRSSYIGMSSLFLSLVLLIPVVINNKNLISWLVLMIFTLCVILISMLWWKVTERNQRRIIMLMRIPMIAGIMLLVFY